MKEITATGQTVNTAIESTLSELKAARDKVEINVIDEGKRGLLGIFGSRPAVVKVKVKIDPVEEAKNFLKNVCENMQLSIEIEPRIEGKYVYFNITSEKTGLIIGKRGQTLNALQSLAQLVLNRYSDQFMVLSLDAENYRKRREESLVNLASRVAKQALREKREVSLEPMPSFERKIIHAALSEHKNIKTYSVGNEPHRYLVVSPK